MLKISLLVSSLLGLATPAVATGICQDLTETLEHKGPSADDADPLFLPNDIQAVQSYTKALLEGAKYEDAVARGLAAFNEARNAAHKEPFALIDYRNLLDRPVWTAIGTEIFKKKGLRKSRVEAMVDELLPGAVIKVQGTADIW